MKKPAQIFLCYARQDEAMTLTEAKDYVRDLNQQRFAGYNNWRLPTLEEAMSLMEPRKYGELHIDSVFDRESQLWTADKSSASLTWLVIFRFGFCAYYSSGGNPCVRAVR